MSNIHSYRSFAMMVVLSAIGCTCRADTYQFTLFGPDIPTTSFTLPSSPRPMLTDSEVFGVDIPLSAISPGATGTALAYFGNVSVGAPDLSLFGSELFVGPMLYTGSLDHPTFLLGSFSLTRVIGMAPADLSDTLTITDISSASETPEPSSSLLLLTGALPMAVMGRRVMSQKKHRMKVGCDA